jgi:hypothetical protein
MCTVAGFERHMGIELSELVDGIRACLLNACEQKYKMNTNIGIF